MIVPTVGRVVLFRPPASDGLYTGDPDVRLAATICYVHGDREVNLRVLDQNGNGYPRCKVRLRQPEDEADEFGYCEWMEYQIGQAAKTEAAQRELRKEQETKKTSGRSGVTLVELLVVIGIVLVLAALTLPAFRSLTASGRIREPARAVHAYLGRARARAVESGRSCGVMFERLDRQCQASVLLKQVHSPRQYGGDFVSSRVLPLKYGEFLRLKVRPADLSPGIVRRGDTIKLNYQGALYRIIDDPADNGSPGDVGKDFPVDDKGFLDFTAGGAVTLDADGWVDSHWMTIAIDSPGVAATPTFTTPVPFQIQTQPVPSAAAPLKMFQGVLVDLAGSGTDFAPDAFGPEGLADTSPVMVMFDPRGALEYLVVHGKTIRPTGPVYLLIGTWEHVPSTPVQAGTDSCGDPRQPNPDVDDGLYNWEDSRNLWVTVNASGLVTVASLAASREDPSTGQSLPSGLTKAEQLASARELAKKAQITKGGR